MRLGGAYVKSTGAWGRLYIWGTVRSLWQPTPVFLPGKSHKQRNQVGYSPWGCKELDKIERFHFQLSTSLTEYVVAADVEKRQSRCTLCRLLRR